MYREFKHWVYNQHRRFVWILSRIGGKLDVYMPSAQNELYVITVAYNHVRLIEKQIELVKQHVTDKNYLHVIVDNSPNRKVRKQIKEICERELVPWGQVSGMRNRLSCNFSILN